MAQTFRTSILPVLIFVSIALCSRLIPHPANFTAFGALALFWGQLLRRSQWAFAIPLLALVISDLVIGFHSTFLWVYLSFALVALVGRQWNPQNLWLGRVGGALVASAIFFTVSNFGVWIVGGLYPMTFGGLSRCYFMALPFVGNQILGDLFYVGAFTLILSVLPGLTQEFRSEVRSSEMRR